MIARLFSFLSLLALGGALGFAWGIMGDKLQPMVYSLIGSVLASLVWGLVDAWQGYRVRAWLRHGDLAMVPPVSGWWGVLTERARIMGEMGHIENSLLIIAVTCRECLLDSKASVIDKYIHLMALDIAFNNL